ncbi:hypothetical protein [Sphingomonas sp. CCH9-F2]|uniref:hypothetical protein n=1 Tax=Sphingomonas sp. CCH9-F2 TaxID=1768778 RepID=UPI0018D27142|nr:hypothetical protein [Sphingomonas sp. CCH9-F2]
MGEGRAGPLATVQKARHFSIMTAIIYLSPGDEMPDHGDQEPWLIVEASDDGRFFGTGAAWKPSGAWVGYGSLPENDRTLAEALAAAERWADKYGVSTIWVQTAP